MKPAANFTKKVLTRPELAQIIFDVTVLDKYLEAEEKVQRTETVARLKTASWSLDFGISPDEKTIHTSQTLFASRLPESEREHWLEHLHDSHFSTNFLKMQGGQSCVDDGGLRDWGEEESLF